MSWIPKSPQRRARTFAARVRGALNSVEIVVRQKLGFRQSEDSLIDDSQTYWNNSTEQNVRANSHWRGAGIFADDLRWLSVGKEHLDLYEEFSRALKFNRRIERVVEWGCGGGMNAVYFARLAQKYIGVDISRASLEECSRQMMNFGLNNFQAVLIKANDPEAAIEQIQDTCDLLISTYVFELLPTREYGLRILRIANKLLSPGGLAMIQIKYSEVDEKTWSRPWAYARNLALNATYRIEEFWQAAQSCGFKPKMVMLLTEQPLVEDRNYAYFCLQK